MGVMETFIENQGAISGNNATIAENQMKVYEAGVKAGLAQDPDYQEGYEDGRDAALGGVEWQDILNGNTPVGRAKEADHAAKANRATQADLATNATRAANADRALEAESASLAHEATHSYAADRASEADHADEASHASEATHAENADYSTNAGHATTATSASTAGSATTAITANVAMGLDEGYVSDIGFAKFIRGSYVGTGTYGEENPTVIAFPSQVKLLILLPCGDSTPISYRPTAAMVKYSQNSVNPYYGEDTPLFIFGTGYKPLANVGYDGDYHYLTITEFSNRVSFYSSDYERTQRNRSGVTYEYIAIL